MRDPNDGPRMERDVRKASEAAGDRTQDLRIKRTDPIPPEDTASGTKPHDADVVPTDATRSAAIVGAQLRTPRGPQKHPELLQLARADGWSTVFPWKRHFSDRALAHAIAQGDRLEAEEIIGELTRFTRVPDAWRIVPRQDPGCNPLLVLELLEIEVTSAVTSDKFLDYETLWWAFDATSYFELRVYRMDRFGLTSLLFGEVAT